MRKYGLTILVVAFFFLVAVWALVRGDWLISLVSLTGGLARILRLFLTRKSKSSD